MARINKLLRQTADGFVHGVNPIGSAEYTLCGIACDAHISENDPSLESVPLTGNHVTCETCILVIEASRKLRIRKV